MAAKKKALWQVLAAQLLLVAVPLYGSLPELAALASARGSELVEAREARPETASWASKPHVRASSFALETQPLAILEVTCEIASGVCVVYDYDDNGNRSQQIETNGGAPETATYGYDDADRLTEVTYPEKTVAYTLDPAGNRATEITTDLSTSTITSNKTYSYTPRDFLESIVDSVDPANSATYAYDPSGNQIAKSQAGTATGFLYDSLDQLTEVTSDASLVERYAYDYRGLRVKKAGSGSLSRYVYDESSVLVVEHTYDADGTRIRTRTTPATGPPTTIDYLVDPWHQTSATGRGLVLSQVVAETDEAGNLTAYHVRGDDLLATLRPNPTPPPGRSPWIARYFHAEGIGTIRALSNEAGEITDSYALEAFGTLVYHQGDDPNAYLFAGEPLDPNSGFYYNRARWLDPNLGRFAGMDPFGGSSSDPVSLHRYLYANLNPAVYLDPTGRFASSSELLAAVRVAAMVARIAVPIAFRVFSTIRSALYLAPGLASAALTWGEIIAGGIGLLELGAEAALWLEQATQAASLNVRELPPGPGPRGFALEEVTNVNLGGTFEAIDHYDADSGIGVQQRSHVSSSPSLYERRRQLVRVVENALIDMEGIEERDLRGIDRFGNRQFLPAGSIRGRGVLLLVPEHYGPEVAGAARRLADLARQYRASFVAVRLVRGFRR